MRLSIGLSQEMLAARSGVSVRTIRGVENGSIHSPRFATLRALTEPLGLMGEQAAEFCGAWATAPLEPVDLAEFLQRDRAAFELAAEVETQPTRLREIVKICNSVIGRDQLLAKVTMSRTFQAREDRIDRVVWLQNYDPEVVDPDRIHLTDLINCHPGRTVVVDNGVIGHEMLLDVAAMQGQRFHISYSCDFGATYRYDAERAPQPEVESVTGVVGTDVAVYVEQVLFSPHRLPGRIWQIQQRSTAVESEPHRMLDVQPSGLAQIVVENPIPGAHGIRWAWD